MATCKITVLKLLYNPELAEQYRRPDIHVGPCPYYEEGQEFIVQHIGERPENFFCDWAWNDIQKILLAMQTGADFSNWMKNGNEFITCCTDGIKPVVFKIERLEA
jgi:uncharacterized repeat protein (TIGR04076 family)